MDLSGTRLRAYLAFTRASAAAFGLLQLSVLARLLPASEYAIVAASIAVAAYFQLLGEAPISGYQRLGNHRKEQDSEPGGARSSADSVLMSLAVVIPLGGALWGAVTDSFLLSVAIALWVVSLIQVYWSSVQYLNWQQRSKFGTLQLVNSAMRTLSLSAGAYAFGEAAPALMLGSIASIAATALVSPRRPPFRLDRRGIRVVLAVGIPMTVVVAATTSLANWPTIVGSRVLPVTTFASYAAQSSLAAAAYGTVVGFILVFGFPSAKQAWDSGDRVGAEAVVSTYLKYVAVLGPLIAAAFWVMGDFVTGLLLGSDYSGHAIPAASVAVGAINSVCMVLGWVLRLQFRQNALAAVAVGAALVQLPLCWWATTAFGIHGLLVSMGVVASVQVLAILAVGRTRHQLASAGMTAVLLAGIVAATATIA